VDATVIVVNDLGWVVIGTVGLIRAALGRSGRVQDPGQLLDPVD
jgi:hypothetical protein